MLTRRLALAWLGASPALLGNGAIAQARSEVLTAVRLALRVSDQNPDYLRAKLAFDAIVNPSLDNASASRMVDRLTAAANELAGTNVDDARKLASVRTAIYQPGAWNDHRPFAYDMRDPWAAISTTSSWPRT